MAWNAGGLATAPQVSFTTIVAVPAGFVLLTPANGAANQPIGGSLTWQASARADSFAVYFGTDNPPATLLRRVAGGVTTTLYSGINNQCTTGA